MLSWWAASTERPFVVALVLGDAHADPRMPAVTRTYLRWSYEERVRAALEKLGTWVEETVTSATEPGEVLAHRGPAAPERA